MARLTNTTLNSVRQNTATHLNGLFTYFAVGTGSTPASVGDTALEAETFQKEIEASVDLGTSVIFSGFQNALENNGNLVNEVGYKTGSGGTLRARAVLTQPILKESFREIWTDLEIRQTVTQVVE